MGTWRLWTRNDAANLKAGSHQNSLGRLRALPTTLYEHVFGGKLPRNHENRAYRLCVGSHLVAAVALTYRRSKEILEVNEVLGAVDADPLLARDLLLFVLTDAYRCSGGCSLNLVLRGYPTDAAQLNAINKLARDNGVILKNWGSFFIDGSEGRQLYLALSGLSKTARQVAQQLEQCSRIRAESICYLIHAGIWSLHEVESLLLNSAFPDLILGGGAPPGDRVMAQIATDDARRTVLLGRLDRFVSNHWQEQGHQTLGQFQRTRDLEISCETTAAVRRYRCRSNPPSIQDWCRGSSPWNWDASAEVLAIGLARSLRELTYRWNEDVGEVQNVVQTLGGANPVLLAVPSDFDQLDLQTQRNHLKVAEDAGLLVVVAPDTFPQISSEVRRRLNFSRIMRK